MAASDSALPASVPPTPPTSAIGVGRRLDRAGDLGGDAEAPAGHAAADRLADVTMSGSSPYARGVAARARAERVGLVDDQQRARARR